MGDSMVDDSKVQVLIERVNGALDGMKKIEGKLDLMVQMQLSIASIQEQMKTLQSGQQRLFEKSDGVDKAFDDLMKQEISPLHDEMVGNKRAVRVLAGVGTVLMASAGLLYSQWKPWQVDLEAARQKRDEQLAKYQFDIGTELRKDDNRLTVLEFRANNVDSKGSK